MHKSYQSTLPAANRLLKKKWDDKYYDEHRLLVRDARPSIDTRPPRTYMHLHMKLKKLQVQEERTETIERDNRILLEKMANTMRTTGYIDHRNNYEARSLNQEKRRRELLRVAKENGTLAKRIVDRKPVLARQNWERSSQQNGAYLNNIAKYKQDWHVQKSATGQQTPVEESTVEEPENPPSEEKKGVASLVKPNQRASAKEPENPPPEEKKGVASLVKPNQRASAKEPENPPPEEKKGVTSLVKPNQRASAKGGNDKTKN